MEYVIWGIPKDGTEEVLLMAKFDGKPITSRDVADRLAGILATKYGAAKTRVQEVDLTDNKIQIL